MALTAARTELNVSLVGEDETIRMLEDAKKRMADLEAKTRSLTGATKAQTDAANAQKVAALGVNDRLKGLAERAEGVVGGIDKVKGAFEKVIGVAGFLGSAITGAVSLFNFLNDAFDDSEEKAAVLEAQMKRNKAETDRLAAATNALTSSMLAMQAATGQSAATLASERATLAEMRGDVELAEMERVGAAVEQRKLKAIELTNKETEAEKQRLGAVKEMSESQARLQGLETKREQLLRDARKAESQALNAFNKTELKDRAALLRAEAGTLAVNVNLERSRLDLARQNRDAMDDGIQALREQQKVNKEIIDEQLIGLGKQKEAPKPTGGGGGGRPIADETAQREADWEAFLSQLDREIRDRADYARHVRQMSADERERQKKLMGEPELFAEAERMRKRIAEELAALPGDVTSKAFDPLRGELEKTVKSLDEVLASRVAVGDRSAMLLEEEDAIAAAYDKQREALDKLKTSTAELGETRAKAREESEKLREQMERDNLTGYVTSFADALQSLGAIQAPAFAAVTESLSGITAQMEKFKGGQQTLTQAVVGSGAAIAAAVGKQVESVRVEAGIRAIFETAMGFANLANPALAAGHFTAAATFGLVAGGLIPVAAKTGGNAGGQKAPAREAKATTEGGGGGMGGQITNVYNLQTGIIDGQSTALAFRRAEMTARNTGMASAGGW